MTNSVVCRSPADGRCRSLSYAVGERILSPALCAVDGSTGKPCRDLRVPASGLRAEESLDGSEGRRSHWRLYAAEVILSQALAVRGVSVGWLSEPEIGLVCRHQRPGTLDGWRVPSRELRVRVAGDQRH